MELLDLFENLFLFRICVLFIFGLCIGSFLNVVIYRLPIILTNRWKKECQEFLDLDVSEKIDKFNLSFPSSHCPKCQNNVPVWANIPIIGFLILRGKCHICQVKISGRYPLVELLTGVIFASIGYVQHDLLSICITLVFFSMLIALIFIDLDTFLLPDELTLPLVWIGLLANLNGEFSGKLEYAVIGAVAGYMSLWIIYWGFKLMTGKEGMGYGDFKLLSAIGAFLGVAQLCNVLIFASLMGIIYAVILRARGKLQKGAAIPFGPFLGTGAIMAFFFGSFLLKLF